MGNRVSTSVGTSSQTKPQPIGSQSTEPPQSIKDAQSYEESQDTADKPNDDEQASIETKKPRRLKGRKATTNTCSTSPKSIRIAKRRAEALDLRAIGYSFKQIGERLKIGMTLAYNDVAKALEEITAEPAQRLLKLELKRCDELQSAVYETALKGDPTAINTALRVMAHRAMLLGWSRDQQGAGRVVISSGPGNERRLDIQFVLPTSSGGQRAIGYDDLQHIQPRPQPAMRTPDSSSPPLRIKPQESDIVLDKVQPSAWRKPRGSFDWS